MSAYGRGAPLVADTSAWARRHDEQVRPRWVATLSADLLVACPVVALELLAAARDATQYDELDTALRALRQAPVTAGVCEAALSASRELSRTGSRERRIPAADHLIAAAAAERGFGVLHYDRDYDRLAGALGFESVWIAAPGVVD